MLTKNLIEIIYFIASSAYIWAYIHNIRSLGKMNMIQTIVLWGLQDEQVKRIYLVSASHFLLFEEVQFQFLCVSRTLLHKAYEDRLLMHYQF